MIINNQLSFAYAGFGSSSFAGPNGVSTSQSFMGAMASINNIIMAPAQHCGPSSGYHSFATSGQPFNSPGFSSNGSDILRQFGGWGHDRQAAFGGGGHDFIRQHGGPGSDLQRAHGGWGHDNIAQRGGW